MERVPEPLRLRLALGFEDTPHGLDVEDVITGERPPMCSLGLAGQPVGRIDCTDVNVLAMKKRDSEESCAEATIEVACPLQPNFFGHVRHSRVEGLSGSTIPSRAA